MVNDRLDILKTLRRIVLELSAASDLLSALNVVAAQVREVTHADSCRIFLIDEETDDYVLMAATDCDSKKMGKIRFKRGEGLVGLVGEREEPINLKDMRGHPRFHAHRELDDASYKSFIGVPLINHGELLGVLTVQQKASHLFAAEEEAFLITLAVPLALEIMHAEAQGALARLSPRRKKKTSIILQGLPGAPGIAIGQAVVVYPPADLESVPDQTCEDIQEEIRCFELALSKAREEIYALELRAKNSLSIAESALFDAYLRLLDSRTLMNEVEDEIQKGQWAQGALKRVIKRHVAHFESLDDPYLRERAADFRDLGRRILSHMQAEKREQLEYPKNTILISQEVSATALMEVPEGCLIGVISGSGSGNSHVAILARALGLPTVMDVNNIPLNQLNKQEIIVDGYNGDIYLNPSAALKREFRRLLEEEHQLDEELAALRDLPACTEDGHVLSLYVNTGLIAEGNLSLSVGAEGVGLYRTEMPFMVRDRFPSEEEQRIMYRQLLNTFAPRPVVMRTLDIGGDKTLSYFPIREANPFLGWRGVRVTLSHPEIFLQQIRAMLQANVGLNNLSLLLPMVTSIREVEESIRLLNQAYRELSEENPDIQKPPLGLMVEVPAAAYQAYELAKKVDFISVGSNDLIQYLLAVDRNNPRVAYLYDGLHPAVLRALFEVVKAGHRAGKKVGICGELASDPIAAVLLLGMEFDSLSMNARSLPRIKWVMRSFTFEKAKQLVKEVLKMDDSIEVRCHMELALEEAGLAGLIRAGK